MPFLVMPHLDVVVVPAVEPLWRLQERLLGGDGERASREAAGRRASVAPSLRPPEAL